MLTVLRTLLTLCAVCTLCLVAPLEREAKAIDFKIDGFIFQEFTRGHNMTGVGERDFHEEHWIMRIGLRAIASEDLSGYVQIEAKQNFRGYDYLHQRYGAALCRMFQGYIDWRIPHTSTMVRMGRQYLSLPPFANGKSTIFYERATVDGISFGTELNKEFSLTGFWARTDQKAFKLDEDYEPTDRTYWESNDQFGLWLTYKTPSLLLQPFVACFRWGDGMTSMWVNNSETSMVGPAVAGWAGLGLTWRPEDTPWTIKFGGAYGEKHFWGDAKHTDPQHGFFVDALVSYKFEWGTPELYCFYGSGDNDDAQYPYQGSMPSHWGRFRGSYAFYNGHWLDDNMLIDNNNGNGAWAVRFRITDIPSFENVRHLIGFMYVQGTNSPDMINKIPAGHKASNPYRYLTTEDNLWEFDFSTRWDITKELIAYIEAGYIKQNFATHDFGTFRNRKHSYEDAWKICVQINYFF